MPQTPRIERHFTGTETVRDIMRFELGLEKPDPKRALRSAVTIAGAYIAGGEVE